MATRLGGSEKDFSMLFTYAAIDSYLDEKNETHIRLAQLLMETHRLALFGDTQDLAILEKTIGDFAISLFV